MTVECLSHSQQPIEEHCCLMLVDRLTSGHNAPLRSRVLSEDIRNLVFCSLHPCLQKGEAISVSLTFLVTLAEGSHPFSSRTRSLSPPAPMILGFPGKVGRCQDLPHHLERDDGAFLFSKLGQNFLYFVQNVEFVFSNSNK